MKADTGRTGSVRRRRTLAATAALCGIVGLCAYWILAGRSMSPQEVCDRAVAALRDRDPDALYALASATEIRKTHITRGGVRQILNQTIWRSGRPTFRSPFVRDTGGMLNADRAFYMSTPPDGGCAGSMSVEVLLDQDGQWHLNLSNLLRLSCDWAAANPCDNRESGDIFRALARRNGMIARRIYEGYVGVDAVGSPLTGMPVDRSE